MSCEVPPRRWRAALSPARVVLAVIGVVTIVVGMAWGNDEELYTAPVCVGLGLAIVVITVLFPVIREVECGFPSGVKISAGLRSREEELGAAFTSHRGDLELYAHLLCGDPVLAEDLLEAAWAKTAATWRGPVTPELRLYVLCVFVQLLSSHQRWIGPGTEVPPPGADKPTRTTPLDALTFHARVAVVLREFAGLPRVQIAALTGRSVAEVSQDLLAAQAALDDLGARGGAP